MDAFSTAKETRQSTPYLDALGLHGLMLAEEPEGGGAAAAALPTSLAAAPWRPASDDGQAREMALGEALMPVKAPAAPEPDGAMPPLPAGDEPLAAVFDAAIMAFSAAPASLARPAPAAPPAARGEGHALDKQAPAQPDPADIDLIRVAIVQDADIDQDTAVAVTVLRGDDADIDIAAASDVTAGQEADVQLAVVLAPVVMGAASAPLFGNGVDDLAMRHVQTIDLDSTVHVAVRGFAGEVVIGASVLQDADVAQQAEPSIVLDADDEGFDLDISQWLDIDVLTHLDIDIEEDGGRLFVTVSLRDRVASADGAALGFSDSDDDVMDVEIRQSLDIEQKLTITLDIEQELAALFDIDVDVDADLDVDARQRIDADIDVALNEEIDVDIDGGSDVQIANQIQVRIDFG